MNRITLLKGFTLAWCPLSHWFYPDWYHQLLGFQHYDHLFAKIIGTIGFLPSFCLFFAAANPIRTRDIVIILLVFFVLMAGTYVNLIRSHGFPEREYVYVALLLVNAIILGTMYPWRQAYDKAHRRTLNSATSER